MAIYRAPVQPRGDDRPANAHNKESTSNSAPDLSTMFLRDVFPVILETRRTEQILLKQVELSLTAEKRKNSNEPRGCHTNRSPRVAVSN